MFCNFPLVDLLLPAFKGYWYQYKVLVGLVLLSSNHMFGSVDLSILVIFENFEIALILLRQIQNFQKCTWAIYPKSLSQTCNY